MERSGLSIEVKVVLLVAAVLFVHDVVLLWMFLAGVDPGVIQMALGGVLVLSLIVAAVWGNSLARATRRLTRACYVARKGDTGVLSELTRMDELGQLNDEINRLVLRLRDSAGTESELELGRGVIETFEKAAPEIIRASHELLVALKELKEGAVAETAILRKVSGGIGEASGILGDVIRDPAGYPAAPEAAARLKSLGSLARDAEVLADTVVDEIARPTVDEAALARAVNGLRDAVRTMAQIASSAVLPLERREADAQAALRAADRLATAESEKADGSRVAELMEKSASTGLTEATRIATSLRQLGVALEAYGARRRVGR